MEVKVQVNPFLVGNFAPIRTEDDFTNLPIKGEVPKGLNGTFYRNGPNPQFDPVEPDYHWFFGDGMIHAFELRDGKASYKNRWVRTPKWELEHARGKALFNVMGEPLSNTDEVETCTGGLANTNIIWHAGRLLALEEAHQPFELDPKTLEPRGYVPYAGFARSFTAHPKIDPDTGELIFFGYMAGDEPLSDKIGYGVVDRTGKVTRLDMFQAPYASMIHDFFVTKSYVMFPVLPLSFDKERAAAGAPVLAWDPSKGSHIGVMKRDAGVDTIRWFTTDPCFVFHPMNMWEDGDKLFVDVMQYDSAPLVPNADGSPQSFGSAMLTQWTIDLSNPNNTITRRKIDDTAGEFPRFDERRAGLQYRHGYFAASSQQGRGEQLDAIAHIDFGTGNKVIYGLPPGDITGEPVFIPRSADAPEGDGWLVAVIYRGKENRSDFVIFDASNIGLGPVATVQLPRRVPFGFHGNWVPA